MIAQSRAEGAQRVLLIVPEVADRPVAERAAQPVRHPGAGEPRRTSPRRACTSSAASSPAASAGSEPLGAAPPFDLVVIDEAHEIFAGLHKRYGRDGVYDEASDEALMAHRVRGFLRVGAGAAAHGDADAELARRAVGAGAVRRADRHAARRHHDLPRGVLRRRRPHAGPRPGARAAAAPRRWSSSARCAVRRRSSSSGRSPSAAAGCTNTR